MGREKFIIKGFHEKYAASFAGFFKNPLQRMAATKRLSSIKAKNPNAFAAQTPLDAAKRSYSNYRKTVDGTPFKVKKGVGYGILGVGGAAYAANKLSEDTDVRKTPPPAPYPTTRSII